MDMKMIDAVAMVLMASCAFAFGCGGGGGGGGDDTSTDTGGDSADTGGGDGVGDTAGDDDGGADDPAIEGGCLTDGDCDDSDPCTEDTCDPLDEICSNEALDADGDGYAAELGPGGETCGGTDCDDSRAEAYPGATETCDGVDDDCDGDTMDGARDVDADGFSDAACTGGDDCDDSVAAINPGATEIPCDGIDNDCDGFGGAVASGDSWLVDGGPASSISAAWSGSVIGVAWARGNLSISKRVMFATVPVGGGAPASVETIADDACDPGYCNVSGTSVVWSGSEFGAAWSRGLFSNYNLRFARISGAGAKIGSDLTFSTILGTSEAPSLSWTGTAYGIAWVAGGRHVEAGIIDPSGARVGSDISVRYGTNAASSAAITWSGTEFGLAWRENVGPGTSTGFTRLAADGSPAGSSTMISTLSSAPEILWSGSEYAVVSLGYDLGGIVGIAVTAFPADASGYSTAVVVEPAPLSVWASSAQWSGQQIGIAWVGADASSDMTVIFDPATPAGEPMGASATVDGASGRASEVTTVWAGSSYVVLWTRGPLDAEQLLARRVEVCPFD